MSEHTENQWERTYYASLKKAEEDSRLANERERRERAKPLLPAARRRRRIIAFLMASVYLVAIVGLLGDGLVRHHVAAGGGVVGTATLIKEVDVPVGRFPPATSWQAHFVSDDGSVDRVLVFAEPLPHSKAFAGSMVAARWTAQSPHDVFLAKSHAFRLWVQGIAFLTVAGLVIGAIAFVGWRRRVKLREQMAAEGAAI